MYKFFTLLKELQLLVAAPIPPARCGRDLIVYDAAGDLSTYLKPSKDRANVLYDFQGMTSKVNTTVKALVSLGYRVVVLLDHSVPGDKMDIWLERR